MLQCLSVKPSPSSLPTSPLPGSHQDCHPPPSQGPSADGTPASSGLPSPINLLQEYRHSLYTDSYNEVWTRIRHVGSDSQDQEVRIHHQESIEETRDRILSRVLQPNKECVEEALGRARPGKLTRLVSEYLDESQNTISLFLPLQEGIHRARAAYTPVLDLLSVLPLEAESLTASQCHRAHEIFVEFDSHDDLFPCPTLNGFGKMRLQFSELKRYLDNKVKKSHSRARLIGRASSGPALCLIGTAVVAVVSAAAVTAHSLLAVVVAAPCAANYASTPCRFAKRELARAAQLKAAAKFAYSLDRHLETIDRLVDKVQTRIERDRELIRVATMRAGEPYPIQQVVKHLRSNPSDLLEQLEHLEEDMCLCFTAVNKARRLLLEQICSHHTISS